MSTRPTFHQKLIFVAESDAFQASYLAAVLKREGMAVLGPVRTVAEAGQLVSRLRVTPDAAVVSRTLGGEASNELIAALSAIEVPMVVVGGQRLAKDVSPLGFEWVPPNHAAHQVVDALLRVMK